MRQHTMRRYTITCLILGVAVFFGSIIVPVLAATGTAPASLKVAAISIMIVTLLLPVAFVVAQMFPVGREPIAVRGFGHDAWLTVIVATAMPGVAWTRLGALAGRPVNLIMPGLVTPVVIAVIFLFARQLQQRNIRGLAERAARPAA